MMKWWLSTGNEPEGPFPSDHVEEWLRSGQIAAHTMACPEDGKEWRPLSELDDFAHAVSPPPPPPPLPSGQGGPLQPPASEPPGTFQTKFGVLTAAIVLSAVSLFLELVNIEDAGDGPAAMYLFLFCVGAAGMITVLIFHYGLWQLIPAQFAETTPGKAVGYLFIPFFNCYWAFRSFVGVNRGLNRLADAQSLPPPRANTGVATAVAVFFVVTWGFLLLAATLPSVENIPNLYVIHTEQDLQAAYEEVAAQHVVFNATAFVFVSAPSFVLWLLMVLGQKRMVERLVKSRAPVSSVSGLLE